MKIFLKLKYLVFLSILGAAVTIDQFTKQLVVSRFRYGDSFDVIQGLFNLTYVRNTGAAFGILSQWDPKWRIPFFVAVPLVALVVIGFIFRKVQENDMKTSLLLALVVGGALGNLIDRLTYGYVIDFLDFHWGYTGPHFPAFNVADIVICVGVFLLIIDMYKKDHQQKAQEKNSNAPHSF